MRDEEYEQHEMAACGSIDHLHNYLVDGKRQEQYGNPVPNMEKIAVGWSAILDTQVTAHDVALMMVWFKTVRQSRKHQDDNLDDIDGYTAIARRTSSFAADRRSQ
jgi:hypothetical protein